MASFGTSPNNYFSYPDKSSASRRSSNNFTKFAFNIYGGTSNTNSSSTNSFNSINSHALAHQPYSHYVAEENKIIYNTNKEVSCLANFNNDNYNNVIVGGKNFLKLLLINDDSNDITEELDLLNTKSVNPNQPSGRKMNSITNVKCGFGNFSDHIACGSTNGSVSVYSIEGAKSKFLYNLTDHSRAINSIDFSARTPHQLISGSQDGTIKLWDLRTKPTKASITIVGHADSVRDVKFSPHLSKKLVGIFDSGVIQKFDLRNPQTPERRLNAHTGPGLTISYHPDIEYVASGGRDKQIQIWNMSSNNNDRSPDQVIQASGAISKLSWSPTPANSSFNPSILNNNIAVCFLTDDPGIQIFNLKRKFIPIHILEGHQQPITDFTFPSSNMLWSVSKDKTFMQHDLKKSLNPLDNLQTISTSWGTSMGDLVMVSQDKYEFESIHTNILPPPAASSASQLDTASLFASYTGSNGGSPTNTFTHLQQHSPNLERPNLMRSATQIPTIQSSQRERPGLFRGLSNRSMMNQVNHPTPFMVPISLPLPMNNDQIFEFLATNYLIFIPQGMTLVSVCNYNATVSASVRRFRDCQTWRVISAGLEIELEKGGMIAEIDTDVLYKTIFGSPSVSEDNNSETKSMASDLMVSSSYASHSTQYGSATGAIDTFKAQSDASGNNINESRSDSFRIPYDDFNASGPEKKVIRRESIKHYTVGSYPKNDPIFKTIHNKDVSNSVNSSQEKIDERHENQHEEESSKVENTSETVNENKAENAKFGKNEHKLEGEGDSDSSNISVLGNLPPSNPMPIVRKHRGSFLDSSPASRSPFGYNNIDYDNENSVFLQSSFNSRQRSMNYSSASNSPYNSRSGSMGSNLNPRPFKLTEANTFSNALSRIESNKSAATHKSELTKAIEGNQNKNGSMKSSQIIDEPELEENTTIIEDLNTPWRPEILVQEAFEYASHQGDISMTSTLALLFAKRYPKNIPREQALESLSLYCDILSKNSLFTVASDVIKNSPFQEISDFGLNETTIRTYCPICEELLVNERTKERNMKKEITREDKRNIDGGYWFCDSCRHILDGCAYCTEPIKGMCVSILSCGHRGHFGCMKEWFLADGNTECPAGCGNVVIK